MAQPAVVHPGAAVPNVAEAQGPLALALLQQLPPPWGAEVPAEAVRGLPAVVLLNTALRATELDERWLPRAASLVPQLMRLLRQSDASQGALVDLISRDVVLMAEVLRLASGSFYASRGPVRDVGDALSRLGQNGLQAAMARVVLRPLFAAERAPDLAPLQSLLQRHTDWQAEALAAAAAAQGLDHFDGYLAGLLHGAGWQALLRIVAAADGGWSALSPSPALAALLAKRAHRLFGRAAQGWGLTPAFTAFAAEAASRPLTQAEAPSSPLTLLWAQLQAQSPALSPVSPGERDA
jgi:hypothetical protein